MRCLKLIIFLALACPLIASAQLDGVEYDWKEKKNKQGISVLTSSVEGSPYKAVRGVMVVNADVKDLVALVEDLEACPEWAAMCKEARVEKRISDQESFAYIYNNIPFPVTDRDVYTHVVWTVDPETKRVSMTSTATDGVMAKTKAVRIKDAVSQWHFTPQADGTTIVENFAHIDPNGPTPAWVSNLMLVSAPFKSMKKMREIVEAGTYADAKVPFLGGL